MALLECDEFMRELVGRWLAEVGHHVENVSVKSPRIRNGFDLVIVDVPSPRSATPLIRALQALHDGPLLLVSGRLRRSQGGSKQLARQLGVKAVLAKPFSRAELMHALDQAMS
jgi:CheY-like chemotaxis protein